MRLAWPELRPGYGLPAGRRKLWESKTAKGRDQMSELQTAGMEDQEKATSEEDVLTRVRKLVAEELNVDENEVTPEASFQDDLGADSLALVELIMAFEDKFDIDNIPDEDAEKIKTVRDAADYLTSRI